MPSNLSLGLGTKLAVWFTVCGICLIPTDLNLNFPSAIAHTLQDKDEQGTDFTSVQANFKAKAYDLDSRKPNTLDSSFGRTAMQGINTSDQLLANQNASFTTIKWSTVAPSPIGRTEAASAVVNGKLYVFGGYIDRTYTPTTRSDVYNPANNTWTRIKNLPIGLTHAGTAVHGKNIYLAGGYPAKPTGGQRFATRNVWKYNVDTNTWTAMPPLPQARGSGGLEVLNRKLHFFGGVDSKRIDKGNHWVMPLDNLKQGWTPSAPLPNPRSHLADAVIGGKLYAIGGQIGKEHEGAQKSVHVWNPAQPYTWKAVASLPKPLSHVSASTFVMDGRIIVVGGMLTNGRSVSSVKAYNPLSNSWEALTSMPAPRHSGVAGKLGNRIFYSTGDGFNRTTYKGVPVLTSPAQS